MEPQPAASAEDFVTLTTRLEQIVNVHISDLFQGSGSVSSTIPAICNDIRDIVQILLDQPEILDLGNEASAQLLKTTLPALVEVFVRRKNKP